MKKILFIVILVAVLSLTSIGSVSAIQQCSGAFHSALEDVFLSFQCNDDETCGDCYGTVSNPDVPNCKCLSPQAGLVVQTANAQEFKPNECCQIKAKFKLQNTIFRPDCIVGLKNGYCKIKGVEQTLTIDLKMGLSGSNECSEKQVRYADEWAIICLLNTLYTITNWIFYLLGITATIMIIYGGFTYITSAGEPNKASKGKQVVGYALIGLVIASLAKILPSVIKYIMGVS